MSEQDKPTCKTCPYYFGHDYGNCRIRSVVSGTDLSVDGRGTVVPGIWPRRDATEWCGEHPDFVVTRTFHLLERENQNLKRVISVARDRLLKGIGALNLTTGPVVAAEQDLLFVLEDHTYGEAYSDDTSE